jgi:hypothetical protein
MTIRPGLIANIKTALSSTLSPNLTVSSKGDDLYEAYSWSVILDAARNKGATILFKDVHGNTPSGIFNFRTSPGEIWWSSKDYCHAEINFPNEADVCRSKNALPRASKVILSVEAKYYVGSTLGLGRAFFGALQRHTESKSLAPYKDGWSAAIPINRRLRR